MDEQSIRYHIKVIGQTIIEMRHTNERLALLRQEFDLLEKRYAELERKLRLELCALMVDVGEVDFYENYGISDNFDSKFPTSTPAPLQLNANNFGNGFGNQPKTSKQILKELEDMIVELHIKGSVRQRDDGRFEYRSGLLGSIYGWTREEIEQKITQKLKEVSKHKKKSHKNAVKTPLLSEFFISQYLPYKKQTLAERSIMDIQVDYNFIVGKGKFNKPLDKYTTANIETFLYTIPQTRKRQKVRGLINNILTYAKRIGVIKSNPCEDVERVKHEQKIGEALSFQEQLQFFENLFADTNIEFNHKLYFVFVYLTGTRRSEALSVSVNDVDFENNTLHIPGTKTKGSNRTIPLFPLVKSLLQEIVPDQNGEYFPIKADRVDGIMRKVKDNAHHPHELCHTFGTIKTCVEKLDPKTVSLYLGHTTTNMTLTRYTHPEQLDKGLFYNGSLSEADKLTLLKEQYQAVLDRISDFIGSFTH